MPRLLCKFKYWNYSVITLVWSLEKLYHTSDISTPKIHLHYTTPSFNWLFVHRLSSGNKISKFEVQKKCITLVRIEDQIAIIELNLDTPKIHWHIISSFNLIFGSHTSILWKPIWDGCTDVSHYYSSGTGIEYKKVLP